MSHSSYLFMCDFFLLARCSPHCCAVADDLAGRDGEYFEHSRVRHEDFQQECRVIIAWHATPDLPHLEIVNRPLASFTFLSLFAFLFLALFFSSRMFCIRGCLSHRKVSPRRAASVLFFCWHAEFFAPPFFLSVHLSLSSCLSHTLALSAFSKYQCCRPDRLHRFLKKVSRSHCAGADKSQMCTCLTLGCGCHSIESTQCKQTIKQCANAGLKTKTSKREQTRRDTSEICARRRRGKWPRKNARRQRRCRSAGRYLAKRPVS